MKNYIYMAVTRIESSVDYDKPRINFVDLYFRNPGKNYKRKYEKVPFSAIEHIVNEPVLGKEVKVKKDFKKIIDWYFYEEPILIV